MNSYHILLQEADNMTFQKLDDNTVRCILSQEDMDEHGLKLEDFFTNKDKARSFLEGVVKQACDEVGYEASGDTLAMQVMPLPHNGLAITFSERCENPIQNMLEQIKADIAGITTEEVDQWLEEAAQEETVAKKEKKKKGEKKKGKKTFFRVYRFERFEDLEQFCASVSEDINVKSQLYKDADNGKYYLIIEKGRLSVKNLERICYDATDFSTLISKQESYIAYCREHYTCMIKKNAIKILRGLA